MADRPVADFVTLQIANHIANGIDKLDVTPDQLADWIGEITVETTITGASLLAVTIIDPFWVVQRSGICATDDTGELANDIDVNYPEGSDLWWRLAMVEGASVDSSSTDANLTLTFIDRIVSYLQDDWGPVTIRSGSTTRAQFIAQLAARIPKAIAQYGGIGEGPSAIRFVCPDENIVQPVASSSNASSIDTVLGGQTVQGGSTPTSRVSVASSQQTAHTSARVNKTGGIGAGAALKVKDQTASAPQISVANALLTAAKNAGASAQVMVALIVAAIYENSILLGTEPSGRIGPLSPFPNSRYTNNLAGAANQATDFCKGGGAFKSAISKARSDPSVDPVTLAEYAEGAEGQYQQETFPAASAISEAKAFVAAYGSAAPAGGSLDTGTTGGSASISDVSQLARGTTQNPDEDSWTCIQRLAGDVNWSAFSNGEYLYYMDGPTMIAQMPALYLRLSDDGSFWQAIDGASGKDRGRTPVGAMDVTQLSFTFDNTSYAYQSTHKRRNRVQRKTAIRKPQTASQVQFNLVCDSLEYRAGDVFVFQNAGSINGRWIVEDTIRNEFADTFTQFTLGPAVAAYPEPQATNSGTSGLPVGKNALGASTSGGNGAGTAQAAYRAAQQLSDLQIPYPEPKDVHYPASNANPHPPPLDCSSSTCWVLHHAGMFPSANPTTSTGLESWGQPGAGNWMTVHTNALHAWIEFKLPGEPHMQGNTVSGANGFRLIPWNQWAQTAVNGGDGTGPFTPRHFPSQ